MNFDENLEHVITLFNNANKIFHENEVDLQDKSFSAKDKNEVVKAIKNTHEQLALKEYLNSLDVETLRKLCTIADYSINAEKDFNYLSQLHSQDDKANCLEKLNKTVQYIYDGKRLLEQDNIQII